MKVTIAIVVLVAFVGCIEAITYQDVLDAEFHSFKQEYKKIYTSETEQWLRKQIFKDNKKLIDKHNARYEAGEETYEMGVNQFTDLMTNEFQAIMLNDINITEIEKTIEYTYTPAEDTDVPEEIDWRAKGAVTKIKNQGSCGSCWAFSTIGTLEGQHFIKTNRLISLSEQNVLDCATSHGNYGCQGGFPSAALRYIEDNGGVDTEDSYPYEGHQGRCRFRRKNIGAKVTNVVGVRRSEAALAQAIANIGPISVCLDASQFQYYRQGVFNPRNCGTRLNHAVLAVGYGHDQSGGDFWLIKNSWGTRWGEEGYIRVARNHGNKCGVANVGVYPTV